MVAVSSVGRALEYESRAPGFEPSTAGHHSFEPGNARVPQRSDRSRDQTTQTPCLASSPDLDKQLSGRRSATGSVQRTPKAMIGFRALPKKIQSFA